MAQAQRLTKANHLLEEVQLLVDQPENVTPFGLRRLDREADKLAEVDAAMAYTIKAAISALEWDADSVRRWTNAALGLDRTYGSLVNAAINLRLIGDISASADLALEALTLAKDDADAAESVCSALMWDARFEEVLSISRRFKESNDSLSTIAEEAAKAIEKLARLKISQQKIRRYIKTGLEVAMESRMQVKAVENYAIHDIEDGDRFVVSIQFAGDIRNEIEMDNAIVEKFLDDPSWDPMRLSVEFKYLTSDELQPE